MKQRSGLRAVLSFVFTGSTKRLFGGAALAALTVIAGIALTGLSGWFISATALAGLSIAAARVFDVFMPSASIRFLAIARTAARYGERLVTHDTTFAISARLREKLFRAFARTLSAHSIEKRPARLLHRLTSDIDALEYIYLRVFVPICAACAIAVLCMVMLGAVTLWLGLSYGLYLVIAGFGLALLAWRYSAPFAVRYALKRESLRARVIELVSGEADLIMNGGIETSRSGLERFDNRLARDDIALAKIDYRIAAAYTFLGTLGLSMVLVALAWILRETNVSLSQSVFVLLTILTVMEVFSALRRGAMDMGRMALAVRRVGGTIETDDAFVDNRADIKPVKDGYAVAVNIRRACHFGSERIALKDIVFDMPVGERIAVIGASGAGKTTLLSAIMGEDCDVTGTIEALPAAWLEQRTTLFNDTLRNNLALAAPKANDAMLLDALKQAGLEPVLESAAEGLNSHLGENNLGLSGGEARRFALARLILQQKPLWLLDEPTESLDTATASGVLKSLDEISQDKSLIIATHLAREAALANRILILERGIITADWRRGSSGFLSVLSQLRPD